MPTNDRHAAHPRNIKNPYHLLRKPAEDRVNRLKKLKLAGTLTDDAARQIDDDCKLQSHLAKANHRERMRYLAFELTHPAATISTNQAAFVAENQGCITLAGLIALIVAEVIANNHPHDHPLPPGNDQLAADIARAHRKIDQIVRSAVKEGALSIRSAELGRKCNQDQEVVAWLDSPALSPPPTELIVTHSDAEFMFAELGLEPRNWYFGKAEHGAAPPTEQGSVQPPEKEESPSPTANAAESQPSTDASSDAEPLDPVLADFNRLKSEGMPATQAAEETGKKHGLAPGSVFSKDNRRKKKMKKAPSVVNRHPSLAEQLQAAKRG
jgi:hypothetical protein